MGSSVQPEPVKPDWYNLHTPEEWQHIFEVAMHALRTNHKDTDALEAVHQAAEALNSFEQPAIEAGQHTLVSGWGDPLEAVKGTTEGVVSGVLAPVMLAKTAVSQGPAAAVDELVNGLKALPDEIASGDARRIGRVGGNVAGGIMAGRAIGAVAKPIGELAKRPGLKNAQIVAQTERANASHAALDNMAAQRQAEAPLKQEVLQGKVDLQRKQLEGQGIKNKILGHKEAYDADPRPTETTNLRNDILNKQLNEMIPQQLQQAAEKHPPTVENIELRNQLLRRKLEGDSDGDGGAPATNNPTPPVTPDPNRPAPPNYPVADKNARTDPYTGENYRVPDLPNPPDPIQDIINNLKQAIGMPPGETNSTAHWMTPSQDVPGAPDAEFLYNPNSWTTPKGNSPLTAEEINRLLNPPKPKPPI